MYDEYLADSRCSSENSDSKDEALEANIFKGNFTVGMDINILVRQTVQNIVQSVCLDGSIEGNFCFGDTQLICFAAALKNNSSILSIQLKHIDVTDLSLVPFCHALLEHPTLVALEICGTLGGNGTSTAIRELVCYNSNILVARIEDSFLAPSDADIVSEALQYNTMAFPDPTSNPFYLGLLRKFIAIEEEENEYLRKLAPQPWMIPFVGEADEDQEGMPQSSGYANMSSTGNEDAAMRKKKKNNLNTWGNTTKTKIGAEVCPKFLKGLCPYGSRCKFYHPEYSTSLSNAVAMSRYDPNREDCIEMPSRMKNKKCMELGREDAMGATFARMSSLAVDAKNMRLQSRLRPPHYKLSIHARMSYEKNNNGQTLPSDHNQIRKENPEKTSLQRFSSVVITCCGAIVCISICAATLSLSL